MASTTDSRGPLQQALSHFFCEPPKSQVARALKIIEGNNEELINDLIAIDTVLESMSAGNPHFTPYAKKRFYRYYKYFHQHSSLAGGAGSKYEGNLESWNASVYLLLTMAGLVIASAASGGAAIATSSAAIGFTTYNSVAWNTSDTITGYDAAKIQQRMGETSIAKINRWSSHQQLILTAAGVVLEMFKYVAAGGALMSFTFAVSTALSWYVEIIEVENSKARLETLRMKLHETKDQTTKETMLKIIQAESYNLAYHERNATAWGACTVAMVAVGIVAFFAMSGMTFGVLPAALVVSTAAAFASALLRSIWVNRSWQGLSVCTKQSQRKQFDTQHELNGTLFKLPSIIKFRSGEKLELDVKLTIGRFSLTASEITLRDYLRRLINNNPDKARLLLDALVNKDHNAFEREMNKVTFTERCGLTSKALYENLSSPQLTPPAKLHSNKGSSN